MREHEAAFTGVPDYIQRAILAAYTQGAAFHPLRLEALEAYAAAWVGPIVQPTFYRQIAQMDQLYTEEVKGAYGRMRCPVRLWALRTSGCRSSVGESWLVACRTACSSNSRNEDAPEVPGAHVLQLNG